MAKITTDNARSQLAPRGNPYYSSIGEQLDLGYRKNAKGGKWVVRRYSAGRYESETLGIADDDGRAADGVTVLTHGQAMAKARQWGVTPATAKDVRAYTVEDALADYFKAQRLKGKSTDFEKQATLHILGVLGSTKLRDLTKIALQQWLFDLGDKPRSWLKGKPGAPIVTAEEIRKRRSSANRLWTVLKAALNVAFREGKVASDAEWRRVQAFEQVDVATRRDLDESEITRFLNAAEPNLRQLAKGALLSGARYGELGRLMAQDFNRNAGTLHIRKSKSGRARHVFLTDAGVAFFDSITAGRAPDDLMFRNAAGEPWRKSLQFYPQQQACVRAGLVPFGFHILRHTYGAQAVMAGVPLQVLAQNLGHADMRMTEKHYAHLTSSFERDTVRRLVPSFGIKPDDNTVVSFEPKPTLVCGAP